MDARHLQVELAIHFTVMLDESVQQMLCVINYIIFKPGLSLMKTRFIIYVYMTIYQCVYHEIGAGENYQELLRVC